MKAICINKYRHFKENHLYEYTTRVIYTDAPDRTYGDPLEKAFRRIFTIDHIEIYKKEFNQHFRRFL